MKQIVVTGGNTGIGYETVRELARMNHRVVFTTRSKDRGEVAIARLRQDYPGAKVDLVEADLADFGSMSAAAAAIYEKMPCIDVVIHNAGTFHSRRLTNAAGIELTFMVNHVAPFYLTHELLPGLKKADSGRIINVNSDSHFMASFDVHNLNLDRRYQGLRAYCRSKLANVYFTYEFERRNPFPQLSVFAVHPGLVNTDIGAKDASFFHRMVWNWRSRGGKTPREGAETSIFLASEDQVLKSGRYWDNCREKKSSKRSYDQGNAALLWDKTAELCGIDPDQYFGVNNSKF